MLFYRPRLVIAGLRGGGGKTTLSLGLLRLFKQAGLNVVAFKKGPDYIDAGWLAAASGTPCYNLDSFIISEDRLLQSFVTHSENTDLALIEGNRGLFDGVDAYGTFSTAALAKSTNSPVVLVVDCIKTTTTVGVIIKGISEFDADLSLKGVVLNYVANDRHKNVVRQAIEYHCNVPVLGTIAKRSDAVVPERHMGLVAQQEHGQVDAALDAIAAMLRANIDIDAISDIARQAPAIDCNMPDTQTSNTPRYGTTVTAEAADRIRIGVIRDSAFQFYYPDNLEELVRCGADIVEISAIEHSSLPNIDALYIGGGFPETNAIMLSENTAFREHLKWLIEDGLPVYAECGGLMFLGRSIIYNNKTYPMTGIFPMDFAMSPTPAAHGYTVAEVVEENPYFPPGTVLKGHEFHYSSVTDVGRLATAFKMTRGKGIVSGPDGTRCDGAIYKNVLASYTHLHALGTEQWATGVIGAARRKKEGGRLRPLLRPPLQGGQPP
ncbi:cobyrinate a,c-diamide synthase [Candidatus Magnetobacterium casense]|uniref:Cobyrinate a,c-diamide synthase n=1 Tax=Candidatus Magnetobacterium casense TaxID=1455061 RepID=A0ABS6RVV6_9BACT|nr:cobyrinate a,c-diamide synthase [Candidatus Magnetobacterium casensis]MBV6340721.1 cobyrinate a,c-diamide synthase [Candidatus Magnetobacterium casensis]